MLPSRTCTVILLFFVPICALFSRYERQLAARVTELTQHAGDTIAQNVELRRQIDEASNVQATATFLFATVLLQIRRDHVTLNAEAAGLCVPAATLRALTA
jgi:hypothetical protein